MGYSPDPRFRSRGPQAIDLGDLYARRVLLLFAFALIAAGVGGLVAVSLTWDGGSSSPVSATTGGPVTRKSGGRVLLVELGPAPGQDLPAYVASRAAGLAGAKGQRLAVVSLNQYQSEAKARGLAGRAQVTSLLAAVPGGTPSVVSGTVADWVRAQTQSSRDDRDEIQRLLSSNTVDDPQFKAFYQTEIDRLNGLINAVKPDGPLVYGVVVRGPALVLQDLARSPDVRLVDVAPTADAAPGADLRGVRPEERAKANDPPTRPT